MSTASRSGETQLPIKMLVGLGNPGDKYEKTRHNAGFWFLDDVASRYATTFRAETKFHGLVATIHANGQDIRLIKPTTFMNNSGRAVSALAKFYKINRTQILVAETHLIMSFRYFLRI